MANADRRSVGRNVMGPASGVVLWNGSTAWPLLSLAVVWLSVKKLAMLDNVVMSLGSRCGRWGPSVQDGERLRLRLNRLCWLLLVFAQPTPKEC